VTVPMPRPRHRLRVISLSRRSLIIALSLALAAWQGWWAFAVFWVFVLTVWIALFMPTWCGTPMRNGDKCRSRARGLLGTCYLHRQAMYKTLWTKVRPWKPTVGSVHRGPCGARPRPVAPWAAGLLATAARLLPAADRARYADEYRSELWELAHAGAGCLRQLRYALRQFRRAPSMGFTLRSPHRRSAAP
jgi:hypothetical protein